MGQKIYIGIIIDTNTCWWKKFQQEVNNYNLPNTLIEIERNDWLEQVEPCSHIMWRPNLSKPFLSQAREKLYLIENILNKPVFPDSNTFWHYDNKNAQKYMADIFKIKMPSTMVSYSYEELLQHLSKSKYPIISKSAKGAGSENVRMLQNYNEAKKELKFLFRSSIYNKIKFQFLRYFGLKQEKFSEQHKYVNYQEFIPNNPGDLRLTTIGDKYAFAFFRNNRDNDFRASGSGKIDYSFEKHNKEVIEYCLNLSKKLKFDSMCYDILYKGNEFFITEFSYIFNDTAIYDCPGYYIIQNDRINLVKGHTYPQKLIVKYLIEDKWKVFHDL